MTLLTTEIHRHRQSDAIIVFAADRRITRGMVHDSDQRKVFPIPRLRAGIGYFGLAEVPTGASAESMAVWIERFLCSSTADTIQGLADELLVALNSAVPRGCRQTCVSVFHLCGSACPVKPVVYCFTGVANHRVSG